MAARVGVSEDEVLEALEALEAGATYRADSLEVGGAPEDGWVRDIPVTDPALDRQRLRAVLPRLDRREQVVLNGLHFEERTQQDLGGELGVSQMQVSRLLARSITKLRR
jgi:RNA polymerase sigma-B factor